MKYILIAKIAENKYDVPVAIRAISIVFVGL